MYKPVLIGSRAALHGGFLPPWRNGKVSDTDVVCERDFVDRFCAHFRRDAHERSGGRGIVPAPVCHGLNYVIDDRLALMNELCSETATFEWSMGEEVLVAPTEVVWATRVYTVGFNPRSHEKAVRDLAHYQSLPLRLTDRHLELAELVRRLDFAKLCASFDATE